MTFEFENKDDIDARFYSKLLIENLENLLRDKMNVVGNFKLQKIYANKPAEKVEI